MENLKYKLAMPLIMVAIGVVLSTAFSYSAATTPIGDAVRYTGVICACKNSEVCYEGMAGANCNHNNITNAGKNAVEIYLRTGGAKAAFNYLAVGTGDEPAAASTTLDAEQTGGLARATATISDNGVGNWSLYKIWTADGAFADVKTAGIFNESAAGTLFAGGGFAAVTLASGDTLAINYTLALA